MSQDFSKGKIYKITNDYNDDVYVGSTCNTLVKLFSAHKNNKNSPEKMVVSITDIAGKVVSTSQIVSTEGNNLIILPTEGMSSGTYFVKLGNNAKALKFVVK